MNVRNQRGYTLLYVLVVVFILAVLVSPMLARYVHAERLYASDDADSQAYFAALSGLTRAEYYIDQFNTIYASGTQRDLFNYIYRVFPSTSGLTLPVLDVRLPDGTKVTDTITVTADSTGSGPPGAYEFLSIGTASVPHSIQAAGKVTKTLKLIVSTNGGGMSNPLLSPGPTASGVIQPGSGLSLADFTEAFQALVPSLSALSAQPISVAPVHSDDVTKAINEFFRNPSHQSGEYVLEVTGPNPRLGSVQVPDGATLVLYFANPGTLTLTNTPGANSSPFHGMILVNGNVSSKPNPVLAIDNLVVNGSIQWGQGYGTGGLRVTGTLAVKGMIGGIHGGSTDPISIVPQTHAYGYLLAGASQTANWYSIPGLTTQRTQ